MVTPRRTNGQEVHGAPPLRDDFLTERFGHMKLPRLPNYLLPASRRSIEESEARRKPSIDVGSLSDDEARAIAALWSNRFVAHVRARRRAIQEG